VTLFTRGKTPIAQQIPDDTAASFKAYESKIKHIKGNRQASQHAIRTRICIGCALRASAYSLPVRAARPPPRPRCVAALRRASALRCVGLAWPVPCADGAVANRSRRPSRLR
jgi:hypothetical protein